MKPNFALTLSFEGIDLLHRASDGWRAVGTAQFDAEDLAAALSALRDQALILAPDGITSKLILPENQIKYLSLPLNGTDADAHLAMAETALDGATPYALADLAYDMQAHNDQLEIAAVARETLAEAEAFAQEHGFNPVSFGARPEGAFPGEPFFGETDAAATLLGGPILRDDVASHSIGPALLPETKETTPDEQTAPEPQEVSAQDDINQDKTDSTVDDAQLAQDMPTEAEEDAPLPPSDQLLARPQPTVDTPDGAPLPSVLHSQTTKEIAPPAAPVVGQAGFSFASVRSAPENSGSDTSPRLDGVRRDADSAMPPVFEGVRKLTLRPDQPDDTTEALPPLLTSIDAPDIPVLDLPADTDTAKTAAAPIFAAAPALRMSKQQEELPSAQPEAFDVSQSQQEDVASNNADEPDKNTRQRMAILGSQAKAQQTVGGKPRYLGLTLTALLLLGLAGAAGWASLSDSLFGGETVDVAQAPAPDITQPAAQPAPTDPATETTTSSLTEDLPLPPVEGALLMPAPATEEIASLPPELQFEPEAPLADVTADNLTEEQADLDAAELAEEPEVAPESVQPNIEPLSTAERYAVSGVWQDAPTQPVSPETRANSEVYLASIDPAVPSFDAVALPGANSVQSDSPPAAQALPAEAGTQYAFDERGLVTATAEGALTPDGVMVYLGRPARAPDALPDRTVVEEAAPALPDDELERRAKVRPKARPTDLIESNERSVLGGRTRSELAGLRPKLRPADLLTQPQESDADRLALLNSASAPLIDLNGNTRAAINAAVADSVGNTSLKPRARPQNLDTSTDQSVQQVASAVRSQPRLPSSASVARQATVKNQLNLRKVSLIGVSGTPKNRSALVRLKSGRIKKVSVGDRLDGGRVTAISANELVYKRSSRAISLKMPRG
jgi:hypothetical protein